MRDTVVSVWRAPYLVVAIVLLAGCGGSSGNRLTKEGYAAKADAVCKKYRKETSGLPNPSNIAELAIIADKTLPILDKAINELRALEPPADEQATADQWLAQFGKLKDDLQEIRDKAKTGDLQGVQAIVPRTKRDTAKSNELGTRLGFTVCNQD